MEHKHTWIRSKRHHKDPTRFFVVCSDPSCALEKQAVMREGELHVFHTGMWRGGKARVVSYRLHRWQEEILKERGQTFVKFVDQAFDDTR